jgi:hypothetical protein
MYTTNLQNLNMNYFVIVYARKHFLSPMIKKSTTLVENGVEIRPSLPFFFFFEQAESAIVKGGG